MASSSKHTGTARSGDYRHPHDVESETALLFSHLTLEEIESSGSRYLGSKGKARESLSFDADLAFQLQVEATAEAHRRVDDHYMAVNLRNALAVDENVLQAFKVLEEAAQDDHQAAIALLYGLDIPPSSESQRMLQNPSIRFDR